MRFSLVLSSATLALLALAAISTLPGTQLSAAAANEPGARNPVVIELFTSEGCSSCPPADALVAALEAQQPIPGAEIVAIEEHVDYWNQQGWHDPFSDELWTQRQQAYTLAWHNNQNVYTPQIVVNGRTEFVGNRAQEALHTIQAAIPQLQTEISVASTPSEKRDHLQFKVTVARLSGDTPSDTPEVWIAITEKGLHSSVTRGENAGQDLHHASVLRVMHKLGTVGKTGAPPFAGQSELKLESSWNRSSLRAVAFVQEKRSRHILGAASIPLQP